MSGMAEPVGCNTVRGQGVDRDVTVRSFTNGIVYKVSQCCLHTKAPSGVLSRGYFCF